MMVGGALFGKGLTYHMIMMDWDVLKICFPVPLRAELKLINSESP